jgi:hypothetical protein
MSEELKVGEDAALWHVSNFDYHQDKECESSTTLKLLDENPNVYFRARIMSEIPMPRPSAESINLGSAFEYKLFEPEIFERLVKKTPHGYRSAGFAKVAATLGPEDVLITDDHFDRIEPMLKSVYENPKAVELMEAAGQVQISQRWTEEFGIRCKARHDKLLDCGATINLKTTRDPEKRAFGKQIFDLKYHIAAALYIRGRDALIDSDAAELGEDDRHYFLTVANEEPFETEVYVLKDRAIALANRELDKILRDLSEYRGRFAGGHLAPWQRSYHGRTEEIDLPGYAYSKPDEAPIEKA